MGLSNFPSAGDGLLPAVIISTIFWVDLVKGLLRSCLQIASVPVGLEGAGGCEECHGRVTFTRFKTLCGGLRPSSGGGNCSECCVCLCGFGEEEEVSELSCRHLFHRGCLEKWFGSRQRTCPLCRRFVI